MADGEKGGTTTIKQEDHTNASIEALRTDLAEFRQTVVTDRALTSYLLGFTALITAIIFFVVQFMLSNHVAVVSQSVVDRLMKDQILTREIRSSLGLSEDESLINKLQEISDRLDSIENIVQADETFNRIPEPNRLVNREPLARPQIEREGYAEVDMREVQDLSADDLQGSRIYGVSDEDVGQIAELFVDETGKISSVVINVGGFLGLGEKAVSVTFEELQILRSVENDDLRIYVDSTKGKLDALPEYEQ